MVRIAAVVSESARLVLLNLASDIKHGLKISMLSDSTSFPVIAKSGFRQKLGIGYVKI